MHAALPAARPQGWSPPPLPEQLPNSTGECRTRSCTPSNRSSVSTRMLAFALAPRGRTPLSSHQPDQSPPHQDLRRGPMAGTKTCTSQPCPTSSPRRPSASASTSRSAPESSADASPPGRSLGFQSSLAALSASTISHPAACHQSVSEGFGAQRSPSRQPPRAARSSLAPTPSGAAAHLPHTVHSVDATDAARAPPASPP